MKRRLFILSIALAYLVLCGKSCSDDAGREMHQEQQVKETRKIIREAFETEYLTEEAKFAAEKSAVQKLNDFSDYLKIYTDVSMDTLFRQRAGTMIRELFSSADVRLSIGNIEEKRAKYMTLGQFLVKGFGEDNHPASIAFDSIRVLEPLKKTGAMTYAGKIGCYQTLHLNTGGEPVKLPREAVMVKITATRVNKIFGSDTLCVWTVFLGEMEIEGHSRRSHPN